MATPSEQLDRIKEKEKIEKAKTKAFWMRVTEGIAMLATAAGVEAIAVKTGKTALGDPGTFLGKISFDGLSVFLGLTGIIFARGTIQDIASGMFNAGAVPITRRAVQRALT